MAATPSGRPLSNPCACLYARCQAAQSLPPRSAPLSPIDRIRTHTLFMAFQQPVARELRRAIINGVLWLEMVCLPPHAMAGSEYYASQVPPLPSILSAVLQHRHSLLRGQAPTPIEPALFDETSVDIAADLATSAVAPKAAAADNSRHAKQTRRRRLRKLQAAQDAEAASAQKLAERRRR